MLWNKNQGEGVKKTEGDISGWVVREGFSEELAFEQRLTWKEGASHVDICLKRVSCWGNSKHRGAVAEVELVVSRNIQEGKGAEAKWVTQDNVRKKGRGHLS